MMLKQAEDMRLAALEYTALNIIGDVADRLQEKTGDKQWKLQAMCQQKATAKS